MWSRLGSSEASALNPLNFIAKESLFNTLSIHSPFFIMRLVWHVTSSC